jgi:hypothetical protein
MDALRAGSNTARNVSVHWGQYQDATHIVPSSVTRLSGRTRHDLRPESAKDPGGGERGRDDTRLELG